MNITADLHTHTRFSHGKGTPEQNVRAAIEKGLERIAITDHGPAQLAFGVKKSRLNAYLSEIKRLNAKYAGQIEVLSGLELNLCSLDGDVDVPESWLSKFDILLLGFHKAVWYKDFSSAWHFYMRVRNKKTSEPVLQKSTRAFVRAVERHNIAVVTHLDYGLAVDKTALARACAKRGAAIELNASHSGLLENEIRGMKAEGVKFAVTSDAHRPQNVGRFEAALTLAERCGLTAEDIVNAHK